MLDICAALKDLKASAQSLFLGIVCYSVFQYCGYWRCSSRDRVVSSEGSCQTADYFWIKCKQESCESSARPSGSSTHLPERREAGFSEMEARREESPGGRPQDTRP
ncbi:hypothetical protein QQF64_014132 [Cirrhinus molitorella]|uniref:Uncharacterized protein n=1 Tax=Cirrhinus molitorella TaxID=172907 RepID=A0ABR3LT46_9TELE